MKTEARWAQVLAASVPLLCLLPAVADGAAASAAVDAPAALTPAAKIAAARGDAPGLPLKIAPGGDAVDGVRRDPVRVVDPGQVIDEGDLVVDARGRVTIAAVRRKAVAPTGEGEEIIVQRARTPEGKLGPVEVVSPRARRGTRAWHPRLATGPAGAVWVVWCGTRQARRGVHARAVYLRQLAPGRSRPRQEVSKGLVATDGRHCDPVITVGSDGGPIVAWEAGGRIAMRRFDRRGKALGPASFVSDGPLDRRVALLEIDGTLHLAFDRTLVEVDLRARDPQVQIWLRSGAPDALGPPSRVGSSGPIVAAPALARGSNGRLLIAFHHSVASGLVKVPEIVELGPKGLKWSGRDDPFATRTPAGEVQGAEFPAMTVLGTGTVLLATRPSQGFYLHRLDAKGFRPVLDLTRRGWGARGMRAAIVAAPDGSVLILRRARQETVLERLRFERSQEASGRAPAFDAMGGMLGALITDPQVAPAIKAPGWLPGDLRLGDVHMHSAVSDGTGPPDEILARARTRGLDFAVLSDHDYVVGSRMALSEHDEVAWLTDVFDRLPGFTTLHGYEWTTPPWPRGFGHRNVYFRGAPPTTVFGFKGSAPTTAALNARLRKERAFTAPHHTTWTGTDWKGADPKIQRHFEIVSTHGAFEGKNTTPIPARGEMPGMFALDALKAGLRFGFLGGSDGHGLLWHHGIARKADTWATGLSGVIVRPAKGRSDRQALWDALFARRTFATSGSRMEAYLRVGALEMGQEGKLAMPASVQLRVRAPKGPLTVSLVRDAEVIWSRRSETPLVEARFNDDTLGPGRHFHYLRAVVGEAPSETGPQPGADAQVVWTSPIFSDVEAP